MNVVAKLRACSSADRIALIEALLLLLIASLALRWLSFRELGRVASIPIATKGRTPHRERICERCAWAVAVAAKRSPLRALCFERGLVAQLMLRRRGIDSTLFFGLRPEPGQDGLKGHVWVIADSFGITGTELSREYQVMVSFPPRREGRAADVRELLQPW